MSGATPTASRRWLWRELLALVCGCAALTAVLVAFLGLGTRRADRGRAGGGLRAQGLNPNFAGRHAYPFRLADARGGVLAERQLRGRPYAITFLYSHCRDTCPLIAAELRRALGLLGPAARRVAVVGVSVDPRGDTTAGVRSWLARMGEPANFHYLLGTERQLVPVWNGYFVDGQVPGVSVGTHSSEIYLADSRGMLRGVYDAAGPVDPHDVAHDLRVLLRS